jgi:anti-anti-sigma factor
VRTRDMRTEPAIFSSSTADEAPFTLNVGRRGAHRVVRIIGELDVASRDRVREACTDGRRKNVVVDMAETTFMDCRGYSALVAARRVLQAGGGSLTLRHQTGQPAHLLTILKLLEARN